MLAEAEITSYCHGDKDPSEPQQSLPDTKTSSLLYIIIMVSTVLLQNALKLLDKNTHSISLSLSHTNTHTHMYNASPCPFSSSGGRSSVPDGRPISLETQTESSKPSGRGATPKVRLPLHAVSSSPDTQQPERLFEHPSIRS